MLSAFFFKCPGSDLNRYDRCGSQDFKSCVSTNSTTRAAKKNLPFGAGEVLSGRPGSNRPPRPWQGRALPNELLPLLKELFLLSVGVANIRSAIFPTKIFISIICKPGCTACFRARLPRRFCGHIFLYTIWRRSRTKMLPGKKQTGKK